MLSFEINELAAHRFLGTVTRFGNLEPIPPTISFQALSHQMGEGRGEGGFLSSLGSWPNTQFGNLEGSQ